MSAEAASYFREHWNVSREMMERWQAGWMPPSDGNDGRGKSLAQSIVLPFRNEEGVILGYVSRDLRYEEQLKTMGVVLVQDYMNVLRLDRMQVPAVGICSAEVSDAQIEAIVRLAGEFENNQMKVLCDATKEGDRIAKELPWRCSCQGLNTQLLWSNTTEKYQGLKPKLLSMEQWQGIVLTMRQDVIMEAAEPEEDIEPPPVENEVGNEIDNWRNGNVSGVDKRSARTDRLNPVV